LYGTAEAVPYVQSIFPQRKAAQIAITYERPEGRPFQRIRFFSSL
jgi:hypothetical protein